MEINVQTTEFEGGAPPRIGNVYPVKGGRGMSRGHMNVMIAITERTEFNGVSCLFLTINKQGKPVGVTTYAWHYVEDLQPIAFVEGLEDLNLDMRSL